MPSRPGGVARRPPLPDSSSPGNAAPGADDPQTAEDDSLILLFLCCHPSLAPAAQIALTAKAVGGLTTAEIARAFLVSEATMTRRITSPKQAVRDGAQLLATTGDAYRQGLGVVLHVLYLIFNEGYATTAGENLHRSDLTAEAIRLTRMLRRSGRKTTRSPAC